ncbi:MAG: hypothetical protein IKV80_07065 [Bacteroidales bacterium]|nr:hypothetical protein [Bacteroidales bacterium]
MSATNSTLNYQLPQFIATDKPAWLVDFNGAMSDIDTAIKEAKTAGDNAQSTANTNATNIQTLDGTVTSQGTAIGTLTTSVAGNTGSINTINSLIGNGEPTTTDKTIIGAINEINSKVGDVEADDVSFDNANTGLSATDVQAAIVEVKGLIPAGPGSVDADDVSYDNTSSGLTATDVQAAIDEVQAEIAALPSSATYDFDLTAYTGKFTVTLETGWSVTDGDGGINYALNADKSIGKIYGGGWFSGTEGTGYTWTKIATFGGSILPTITTAYNIYLGCFASAVGATMTSRNARLHFNTDGTCELQIYALSGQALGLNVNLPACIYFLKDFGD